MDGQVSSNNSFCSPDCRLESVPVLFGGRTKPDSDACAENKLYYCRVDLDHQLLRQVQFPELEQKVHLLLGLFDNCVYVGCPLQFLGDCAPQKL